MHEIANPNEITARTYHFHNTLEVIIIRRGWAEGIIGEVPGKIQRGTVVVLGSDLPHGVLQASSDCAILLVHIPYELLKWDEERFPELAHGLAFLRSSKSGIVYASTTFADKMARLAGQIASSEGFMRMSLLMRMIHILSITPHTTTLKTHPFTPHTLQSKDSPVNRAYDYLYKHFRKQITLPDLAAHAGLHPSALCRAFKQASGYTISQFCTRLRIEYACNLLLTTDMDIAQIAYLSGYNTYSHFCNQFKKTMHLSSTDYRAKTTFPTSPLPPPYTCPTLSPEHP